jgi:peptide/nickel transport system ATP-binding protein
MILSVENLSVGFNRNGHHVDVVDNLSFKLERGKTIGIVGESGSGKTLTALSILNLLSQEAKHKGKVFFYPSAEKAPVDTLSLPQNQMRPLRGKELALIFQEPMSTLNPVFTCGQQLTEAIQIHNRFSKDECREFVFDLLNRVKLPRVKTIANAYPHQLSGGQLQRIAIAMAISCNPSLLIADEPTTALDAISQRQILDLLYALKNDNAMSMIFISHDLHVVEKLANHVLVMYKGKCIEYGEAASIFTNAQHPYTQGLLACRPVRGNRLRRLPVLADFMDENNRISIDSEKSTVETAKADSIPGHEPFLNTLDYQQQNPALRIRNIKKYFQKHSGKNNAMNIAAVDGVSFDVFRGEVLGLVGASGCGKSTLTRLLLRLLEPDDGEIYYGEQNILTMTQPELRQFRQKAQLIFQNSAAALDPKMTAGMAIMEPMQVHRRSESAVYQKERAYALLGKVALREDFFHRFPDQLSTGQKQRVCIARALALNPEFLICDEAVSSLDVSVQAQILNLINDLRNEFRFTCIFISHDLNIVQYMCHRIMVMHLGKIVEVGFTEDLFTNSKSLYTQSLMQSI